MIENLTKKEIEQLGLDQIAGSIGKPVDILEIAHALKGSGSNLFWCKRTGRTISSFDTREVWLVGDSSQCCIDSARNASISDLPDLFGKTVKYIKADFYNRTEKAFSVTEIHVCGIAYQTKESILQKEWYAIDRRLWDLCKKLTPERCGIQEGDCFLCSDHKSAHNEDVCTVMKIYPFPRADEKICSVVFPDEKVIDVLENGIGRLSLLPTCISEYRNALAELNHSLREADLQATARREPGVLSVYWQMIPDAASYVVELFSLDKTNYHKHLYKLGTYRVERAYGFFSMEHVENTIVRVLAEDRAGNVIAQTRGIETEYPQYFPIGNYPFVVRVK